MKSFRTVYGETCLDEGVDDQGIFKAIFLAGGPGSGKSFVARNALPSAIFGLKVVDSDHTFEFLLQKFGKGTNLANMGPEEFAQVSRIRDQAKSLTQKKENLYLEGKLGLIIDGTGKDYAKIAKKKQELEQLGYDTYLVFVNTSLEVAKARNNQRDRTVPEELVVQYWNAVQRNIGKFQNLFGSSNFTIVDNNNANEVVLNKVFRTIKKFIDMPPKSKIAKQWVALKRGLK